MFFETQIFHNFSNFTKILFSYVLKIWGNERDKIGKMRRQPNHVSKSLQRRSCISHSDRNNHKRVFGSRMRRNAGYIWLSHALAKQQSLWPEDQCSKHILASSEHLHAELANRKHMEIQAKPLKWCGKSLRHYPREPPQWNTIHISQGGLLQK